MDQYKPAYLGVPITGYYMGVVYGIDAVARPLKERVKGKFLFAEIYYSNVLVMCLTFLSCRPTFRILWVEVGHEFTSDTSQYDPVPA